MDGDATLPCIGSIPERPVESNLPPGRGFFMFLPSMTDDSGPRFSWEGVKLSVAITATDKRLSQQACFHSSEQLASGLCLDNVAPCAEARSEEHTSELQSRGQLVCRLLLENKKAHIS